MRTGMRLLFHAMGSAISSDMKQSEQTLTIRFSGRRRQNSEQKCKNRFIWQENVLLTPDNTPQYFTSEQCPTLHFLLGCVSVFLFYSPIISFVFRYSTYPTSIPRLCLLRNRSVSQIHFLESIHGVDRYPFFTA